MRLVDLREANAQLRRMLEDRAITSGEYERARRYLALTWNFFPNDMDVGAIVVECVRAQEDDLDQDGVPAHVYEQQKSLEEDRIRRWKTSQEAEQLARRGRNPHMLAQSVPYMPGFLPSAMADEQQRLEPPQLAHPGQSQPRFSQHFERSRGPQADGQGMAVFPQSVQLVYQAPPWVVQQLRYASARGGDAESASHIQDD